MIELKQFAFNPLQVNSFLLFEEGGMGILIDPSCMDQAEYSILEMFIRDKKVKLDFMINTHGHFDHLFGASRVKKGFNPEFRIHRDDERLLKLAGEQAGAFGFRIEGDWPLPDGYLEDGMHIVAGTIDLLVIHVPGHSPGGVAFYESISGWLFTGDTLFARGIGRTDLPGGNHDQILKSIKQKLLVFPNETIIYPGHGPSSTIGDEIRHNPFFS